MAIRDLGLDVVLVLVVVTLILLAIVGKVPPPITSELRAWQRVAIAGVAILCAGLAFVIRPIPGPPANVPLALIAHAAWCADSIRRSHQDYPEVRIGEESLRFILPELSGQPMDIALRNLAASEGDNRVTFVAGPPGLGKSAALAKLTEATCQSFLKGKAEIIVSVIDARADLQGDGGMLNRSVLDHIENLAKESSSSGRRVTVFVDSLDELYFVKGDLAKEVVAWANEKTRDHKLRVVLLSRPYAVDALNHSGPSDPRPLGPVVDDFKPGQSFYDSALAKIAAERLLEQGVARGGRRIPKDVVNGELRRIDCLSGMLLGETWRELAQLTFRDLEAIADSDGPSGEAGCSPSRDLGAATLGDAHIQFAKSATRRNIGFAVSARSGGKEDAVIEITRCETSKFLDARGRTLEAKALGDSCKKTFFFTSVSSTTFAKKVDAVITERDLSFRTVSGSLQDVIAAVALCSLKEDVDRATVEAVALGNDQALAIAVTSTEGVLPCRSRKRLTTLLGDVPGLLTEMTRARFGLPAG